MKTKQPKKPRNPAMATALAVAGVTGLAATGVKNAAVIDGALHNVDVVVEQSKATPTISNPMLYIDELSKKNPFWGDVAMRTFTQAIGYYSVSAILWAFRKRNQEPTVKSDIDAFNGALADIKKKEFDEEVTEMQGNRNLPFVEGEKLVSAYKYLFVQCAKSATEVSFDLPSPAVLYGRLMERDTDRAIVQEAYETFQMERFKGSAVSKDVLARMERNKVRDDIRSKRKAQSEIDHIHAVIRDTQQATDFDDYVWSSIPLWAQYKFVLSVYKQTVAAIAAELEKPADERDNFEALDDLAKTIRLELEAARRSEQVKLAFEKNALKIENHELSVQ